MCLLEVSVFRSGLPPALLCAVTVHERHTAESGDVPVPVRAADTAPGRSAPDGWLLASGGVRSVTESGPLAETADPAPGPFWPQGAPDTGQHLAHWLVSHARRQTTTAPRWYVLAEPDAGNGERRTDGLDDILDPLGEALAVHPRHGEAAGAIEALAADSGLSVVYSGLTEPPCRTPLPADQPSYSELLVERMRQLARQGLRAADITRRLGEEGFTQAPGRPERISLTAVRRLLREGVPTATPAPVRTRPRPAPGEAPGTDEWWLPDLATQLAMPTSTLYSWVRRGWVTTVRKETHPPYRWILRADSAELAVLRRRRAGAGLDGRPTAAGGARVTRRRSGEAVAGGERA
ncbi:hypothetical protein [Actinacidiphila acididurans]|uniref:DNA-binding protein n=1 Tax=Actinacidiphila acididurans TaxID=2784346 RepID=A0ABS2TUY5_9ACTN|nr:hypothetical protein [Actinacidiphila acididurans]MBM9507145.1 hypothetical protein [Actinacidiphila acididurans]